MSRFLDAGKSILGCLQAKLPGARRSTMAQRRRHLRVAPRATHVVCQQGTEQFRAVVRDVSATGVRLLLARRVAQAAIISVVSYNTGRTGEAVPLKMRVAWCRTRPDNFEAGLVCIDDPQLVAQSWLHWLLRASQLEVDNHIDRRKSPRVETSLRAGMNIGSKVETARLIDVSVGGASLYCVSRVRAGKTIDLFLPGLGNCRGVAVAGHVVRACAGTRERRLHVRFEQLDADRQERLEQLVRQMMVHAVA